MNTTKHPRTSAVASRRTIGFVKNGHPKTWKDRHGRNHQTDSFSSSVTKSLYGAAPPIPRMPNVNLFPRRLQVPRLPADLTPGRPTSATPDGLSKTTCPDEKDDNKSTNFSNAPSTINLNTKAASTASATSTAAPSGDLATQCRDGDDEPVVAYVQELKSLLIPPGFCVAEESPEATMSPVQNGEAMEDADDNRTIGPLLHEIQEMQSKMNDDPWSSDIDLQSDNALLDVPERFDSDCQSLEARARESQVTTVGLFEVNNEFAETRGEAKKPIPILTIREEAVSMAGAAKANSTSPPSECRNPTEWQPGAEESINVVPTPRTPPGFLEADCRSEPSVIPARLFNGTENEQHIVLAMIQREMQEMKSSMEETQERLDADHKRLAADHDLVKEAYKRLENNCQRLEADNRRIMKALEEQSAELNALKNDSRSRRLDRDAVSTDPTLQFDDRHDEAEQDTLLTLQKVEQRHELDVAPLHLATENAELQRQVLDLQQQLAYAQLCLALEPRKQAFKEALKWAQENETKYIPFVNHPARICKCCIKTVTENKLGRCPTHLEDDPDLEENHTADFDSFVFETV